jgi:hypothetical protein
MRPSPNSSSIVVFAATMPVADTADGGTTGTTALVDEMRAPRITS